MQDDIISKLASKKTISKLDVEVAKTSDQILSELGVNPNSYDALQNVRTRTATYEVVGHRNKSSFENQSGFMELIGDIKSTLGENLLKLRANAKDVNAVLGYMEQTGKVPEVSPIAPPEVSARDTAELMDPGDYFNIQVRQNLKQSYRGLFSARAQFYDNFNKFLSYKQAKETAKAGKLLDENYRLSVEMSEYKQVIFDILSPLTEQAEKELLADEPLKDQIMAMRKMSGTVQSIMNLYSRKHVLEGARIDVKMAELKKELEAAKKLPTVTGYDEEQKNYYSFQSSVESFMKDMQKARDKGAYSDADYNAMSEAYEYGLSVI